jgi:hypothetical protein
MTRCPQVTWTLWIVRAPGTRGGAWRGGRGESFAWPEGCPGGFGACETRLGAGDMGFGLD